MKTNSNKRDKAFLGAIIGGVVGLAGSAVSGILSKRSAKKQQEEQQKQQNKRDTYEMAQNLSASYGDQEYVDEFLNKVKFKNGGKMKRKAVNYTDRMTIANKFKCGGRKKNACGGRKKAAWGIEDTTSLINNLFNAGSSVTNAAIQSGINNNIKQGSIYKGTPKTNLQQPDYLANSNNLVDDTQYLYRCGGRKKARCGSKSIKK